jgi:trehalose 6-phosphate synthase
LNSRSRGLWTYGVIVAGLLAVLTLAIAPISQSLVDQWARHDVESRSRLVYTSIQGPVLRALADGDQLRLESILHAVTTDDRILAVSLCDAEGDLRGAAGLLPTTFSCDGIAKSEDATFSDLINQGRRVLVGTFPIVTRNERMYLAILHDLSYADARAGQAQTYFIAGLFVIAIIFAGVATIMVIVVLRGWTETLRRAVADIRAGRPAITLHRDRTVLDGHIQKLLKDLEVGRTPTELAGEQWCAQSLHDLLKGALPGAEIIVLSNREPYIHNKTPEGVELQTPASGLVSALEPIMRACGGTWIAHGSGTADHDTVDEYDAIRVPPDTPGYKLRRIWLTEEEQEGYYYGFANEGLWPLCHIAFVRPAFRESDWHHYERINRRFAQAVATEARTEDPIVLVQDYHFALSPKMIRALLPKATIISFWHIPWPNAETFGVCPWKEKILEGLMGSSIVGFHTQFHCNNFFETVDRFLESRIDREHASIMLNGQETKVRPYPISIEWPPKALESQPNVESCRMQVFQRYSLPRDTKLAVGIERFDYTKGILDRLRAIDHLLTTNPDLKGKFTFIQVAAPSRSKLSSYSALQSETITLVEEINSRHGREHYKPIHMLIRHHRPEEVFELFRAADLCIVSSLHDGMNLVAKEFVASRDDELGVLVLSSFTGAARELSEALIVNPFDRQAMANAIGLGLRMSKKEQQERMSLMRQQVREQNVYRWAGRMLVDASRIRQARRILEFTPGEG